MDVLCRRDLSECVIECVGTVNETVVPFTYVLRNLTEPNWSFDSKNLQSFLMVEENLAAKNKLAKRKTIKVVYSTIQKNSNRKIEYKITAPMGYENNLYPVLVEM